MGDRTTIDVNARDALLGAAHAAVATTRLACGVTGRSTRRRWRQHDERWTS